MKSLFSSPVFEESMDGVRFLSYNLHNGFDVGRLEVVGILGSANKTGGDLVLKVVDLVVTAGLVVVVVILVVLVVECASKTSSRCDIMDVCWDVA